MSAVALSASLPYFHLGSLDVGIPIQSFGIIVAAGVLIGAALLRRYAEWHGIGDDHIRGLTGWVTVSGFIGAHVFDVIAYQWHDLMQDPLLFIEVWKGISSYGGFIGGAVGFAIYVWWKRLPVRLMADTTIVGLLPAFSIGRIGCTVVSDHIGAAVSPDKWYSFLAMDYPRAQNLAHLAEHYPGTSEFIRAWNLGLIEFLYLIPVNALILWLAFRTTKRTNAGLVTVLTGVLYAPVRFYLDFLRPEETDPRYFGLTFAQWASFLAFGAAIYVATKIFKSGAPAVPIRRTSGEAVRALKLVLKDQPNDKGSASTSTDAGKDEPDEDEDGDEGDEAESGSPATSSAKKPGAPRTRGKRGGKAARK
jgi:phosphatidylglycerol:prolipoprotein diacylglycerol transferase